jgi:serine/threonine protein kinase
MALSYAQGSTLQWLISYGGKLSLLFVRIVSSQLVDAVSYLHSRACVHRDIKPDNLVITCANTEYDNAIWDDMPEHETTTVKELVSYRKRWHVTLIDFGLARALTPKGQQKSPPPPKNDDLTEAKQQLDGTISSSQRSRILNRSTSRSFDRQMSAVGNRNFAAPEILQSVHDDIRSNNRKIPNASFHPIDVTKTLSEHVSFYGLMADAYSIGNTIKYMLTGVSPTENVDDVIALESNPVIWMIKYCCFKKNNTKHRIVKYRRISQIPPIVLRLIKGLTESDPQQRKTVRAARRYPWIDDVLDGYKNIDETKIYYLQPTTAFLRLPRLLFLESSLSLNVSSCLFHPEQEQEEEDFHRDLQQCTQG